jgi:hypothetical protein
VHLSKFSARASLLAAAAALIAVLVAAPGASAATFEGGPWKLDLKTGASYAKGTITWTGANPKTKTAGTYQVGTGQVTNTAQPTGNLPIGSSTGSKIAIKANKKTLTLDQFTHKLTAGKGTFTARVNGKGKTITLFDIASQGKVKPDAGFTQLQNSTSNVTLTKSGAAALNKAFALKAPKRGQKDKRFKAKQKVGTVSFTASRSLSVLSGTSQVVYDKPFVDQLRSCNIELSAVAPATAIAKDASAPEGGANLPMRGNNGGGTLTAGDLVGTVNHDGGTSLDRPAPGQPGNPDPGGKAEYHSPLTNFTFGFGPPPFSLTAFVVNSNNNLPIGTVTGDLTKTLTAEGGTVNLANGSLNLSDAAAGTLSQAAPPLGANCQIPAGSKIGAVNMTATVG